MWECKYMDDIVEVKYGIVAVIIKKNKNKKIDRKSQMQNRQFKETKKETFFDCRKCEKNRI